MKDEAIQAFMDENYENHTDEHYHKKEQCESRNDDESPCSE